MPPQTPPSDDDGAHPFRLCRRGARRQAGPRRTTCSTRSASRYDLMNDLMSGGLHRVWKDILVVAGEAVARRALSAISTWRAARATSRSASPRAGGPRTDVTVLDINPDMLRGRRGAGRQAPRSGGPARLRHRQCRGAAAARRAASTATRSPSASATCRASRWRSAEAYRVLKRGGHFLCLEFSDVDVPGLDRIYDAFSFGVIPAHRAGWSPATASPTAISSNRSANFPTRRLLRRHDRASRLPQRLLHAADAAASSRSTRPGSFDASHASSTIGHVAPAGARRLRAGARRRVLRHRSAHRAGRGAPAARAGEADRPAATSAGGISAAAGRHQPARPVLHQARPVPGDAPRRRRRRGRQGARSAAGPRAALPAGGGDRDRRGGVRQADRRASSSSSASRSRPPRSPRSTGPACATRRRRDVAVKVAAARRRAAVPARPVRHVFRGPHRRALAARRASA